MLIHLNKFYLNFRSISLTIYSNTNYYSFVIFFIFFTFNFIFQMHTLVLINFFSTFFFGYLCR